MQDTSRVSGRPHRCSATLVRIMKAAFCHALRAPAYDGKLNDTGNGSVFVAVDGNDRLRNGTHTANGPDKCDT
jgi:hypothetical protein